MTWVSAASLLFALSIGTAGAIGCSSSSSGGTTTVTDSAVVIDTGTDTGGTTPDTTPADTGPAVCWLIKSSQANVQKCYDCSDVKCKTDREAAFGASYLSGTFGGSCKDFAACACACPEGDDICLGRCKVSATADCQNALNKINTCENAQCPAECAPP